MSDIYIFGEAHTSYDSRNYIANRIREIKPKLIIHELLYADVVRTPAKIKQRLANCADGELCDPRLNKDIYALGLEVGASLIGIDAEVASLQIKRTIHGRGQHMLNQIKRYINEPGPIVVVVDDLHLRERDSLILGEASVLNQLAGKAIIERPPKALREAK